MSEMETHHHPLCVAGGGGGLQGVGQIFIYLFYIGIGIALFSYINTHVYGTYMYTPQQCVCV